LEANIDAQPAKLAQLDGVLVLIEELVLDLFQFVDVPKSTLPTVTVAYLAQEIILLIQEIIRIAFQFLVVVITY
jgi:hypothetical protein